VRRTGYERRVAFIGPLPVTGPWTAFGLGRGQFLLILLTAIALFVWIDGPVWRHLHDEHLERLLVSYAVIPPAVAAAQGRNGTFGWGRLFGATVMLGVIKLVVTAVALAVCGWPVAGRLRW
jgi:hypothetical protein